MSKPPAKSLAPKPAAPAATKAPAPKPAPAKAAAPAPKPAPAKASEKPAAKAADKPTAKAPAKAAAPAPKAAPAAPPAAAGSNRFADRFGPAKAAARTLPEPADALRPAAKADPKLANAWKSKAGSALTEAELLAMPDSEYMNDKQLDFFRARLLAQKEDLLSNAGETTEHLREDTSIVPDPADRATIEEEHALELRTRDRERKLLKKIEQSIALIDAGDYGYCDETGEPIGVGRLLARPTATLSLEAQQRRELKQKMFGD